MPIKLGESNQKEKFEKPTDTEDKGGNKKLDKIKNNIFFQKALTFFKKNENILFLACGVFLGFLLFLGYNSLNKERLKEVPEMITQQSESERLNSVTWFIKGLSIREKYKSSELCVFDTLNRTNDVSVIISEMLGEISKIPAKSQRIRGVDTLLASVEAEALENAATSIFACKDEYRY